MSSARRATCSISATVRVTLGKASTKNAPKSAYAPTNAAADRPSPFLARSSITVGQPADDDGLARIAAP
jgi:hypothetical protein